MVPGGNRFGKQRLISIRCAELQGNSESFVGGKTEAVGEVREAIRAVRTGKNLGHSSARTEEENQRPGSEQKEREL